MNAVASTIPSFTEDDGTCYRMLAASVLQRAVVDVVQYYGCEDKARKALFRDAWEWVFNDERAIFDSYGITLPAVCAILDRECEEIRLYVRSAISGARPTPVKEL